MGSSLTPAGHEWEMMNPAEADPLKPLCSGPGKEQLVVQGLCYADNRAIIHLHGGISPWISDGTLHQWITPDGENTGGFPQGVSVRRCPTWTTPALPTMGS